MNTCYYPFVANVDRCMESCNTLNDLFEIEDLNIHVFSMITGISE